jgi:hypothetical protein
MRRLFGVLLIFTAAGPLLAQAAADPVRADPSRSIEIRVELAWLADPLLCPYSPSAHVVGGSLEVAGYVPCEEVRVRVLEVARRNCSLPLVNALRIRAGLSAKRVSVPAEALHHAALLSVRDELGSRADQVQVSCSPSGLVAVVGRSRSLEEKLHLSQALRRLPGCSAVVNLLRVEAETPGEAHVLLGPQLDPPAPQTRVVARPPLSPASQSAWQPAPLGAPYVIEGDVTLLPPQPAAGTNLKLVPPQTANPPTKRSER